MFASFSAEFRRLTRRRVLVPAVLGTALYGAVVTWILISIAGPTRASMINVPQLQEPGGATRTVIVAATFSSVLVLALFTSMAAGDHARGTWRAALLHNAGRLQVAGGWLIARLAMMALLVAVLFVAGWASSFAAASAEGIDTATWLTAEAWQEAGKHLARALVFGAGWGLLGTTLGMLTRSVPIGLAVGVLYAGPLENVLGDDLEFAQRWFPGLLLRHVVTGASDYTTAQIGATLAVYAAVMVAVTWAVTTRRDVTS